jgi:hypothetical protein
MSPSRTVSTRELARARSSGRKSRPQQRANAEIATRGAELRIVKHN